MVGVQRSIYLFSAIQVIVKNKRCRQGGLRGNCVWILVPPVLFPTLFLFHLYFPIFPAILGDYGQPSSSSGSIHEVHTLEYRGMLTPLHPVRLSFGDRPPGSIHEVRTPGGSRGGVGRKRTEAYGGRGLAPKCTYVSDPAPPPPDDGRDTYVC